MGLIQTLQIEKFRNISTANLSFHPKINLFYGFNGSGKSSLLESIYTMAYGKSYRHHLKSRIIQRGEASFRLFSHFLSSEPVRECRVGIEKSQDGESIIKLNGEFLSSAIELARLLPVQLINPNSYEIIEDGPSARRKYLDWGVFHVEHDFYNVWRNYSRCLKQRNLSLKMGYEKAMCQSWDPELINYGEQITKHRAQQLERINPIFQQLLLALGLNEPIQLSFYRGWANDATLEEAVTRSFESDKTHRMTHCGPHRADLRITADKVPGDDVLSRGQEKIIVTALQLAQAQIVMQQTGNAVIYLLDDLPSELDRERREKLYEVIQTLPGQLFITATERALFPDVLQKEATVFHVEHGSIQAVLPS